MNYRSAVALLALVLCVSPLQATCTFGFLTSSPYAANNQPGDVTTGDFNNDGYRDVVAVNRTFSTISILLGAAGGVLGAPSTMATDNASYDIQAADFNNDNKLDLVLSIPWSNDLTVTPHLKILLGAGNGTFTPVAFTPQQAVYSNPTRIAPGDFNDDGLMDAAAAKDNGWSAMQNVGGKLAQKAEYITNGLPSGITAGDFDGDGEDDVAVSDMISNKIFLYYGVGDGTFTPGATPIEVPHAERDPSDVQAGDFNEDGKDDLAIVMHNPYGSTSPIKIALSNGVARTFAAPVDYGSVSSYEALVRDLDGDGHKDVVLAAHYVGFTVFRGNGDGTFAASQSFESAALAIGLAIDDFDRDGGPDVVVSDFTDSSVDVFLNACGRVSLDLTSSANPAAQGTPITVTGTVVPPPAVAPTGTLTLKRDATILNSGNLTAGNVVAATLSDLTPGTYTITALYSGDSRFIPSTRTLSQVVTVPPFGPPPGLNAISFGGPVQLAWNATADTDHYEVWRNNGAGWAFISNAPNPFFTDATAPASSALLYRVRAIAPGGAASSDSAADLALTYAFTDGTLQAGVTHVKLAHLTELRSAANAVRAIASLGAASWTAAPGLVRAVHMTELRTAIQQARTALGLAPVTYTDPTLTAGTTKIKTQHVEELRSAMR